MKYRDHYPANDETRPAMRDAYEETRKTYEKIFGSPNLAIWPQAQTTCGDSHSGLIMCEKKAS